MLISPEYLEEQRELHKNPDYGVSAQIYAGLVAGLMTDAKAGSMLDYGAGKCVLRSALHALRKTDFEYFPYDPAFPEYGPPREADFVCCIDVLEHIEPQFVDAVLNELRTLMRTGGLFTIATSPAIKTLSD